MWCFALKIFGMLFFISSMELPLKESFVPFCPCCRVLVWFRLGQLIPRNCTGLRSPDRLEGDRDSVLVLIAVALLCIFHHLPCTFWNLLKISPFLWRRVPLWNLAVVPFGISLVLDSILYTRRLTADAILDLCCQYCRCFRCVPVIWQLVVETMAPFVQWTLMTTWLLDRREESKTSLSWSNSIHCDVNRLWNFWRGFWKEPWRGFW